jgi:hypothetical protein
MTPPRKTAEPPSETEEEPGSQTQATADEEEVRGWVRDEIKSALDEFLGGGDEAKLAEEKVVDDKPKTAKQVEDAAEDVVREAQKNLTPPEKKKDEAKVEPERPPVAANRLRKFMWGED